MYLSLILHRWQSVPLLFDNPTKRQEETYWHYVAVSISISESPMKMISSGFKFQLLLISIASNGFGFLSASVLKPTAVLK
jgi:hypothetical protein